MPQVKLKQLPSQCLMGKQVESTCSISSTEDDLSSSDSDNSSNKHESKRLNEPRVKQLHNALNLSAENTKEPINNYIYLTICALGICVCYLSCGFINEHLYSLPSVKQAGAISSFVVLTQTFTNFIIAYIWKNLNDNINRNGILNHKLFCICKYNIFIFLHL